MMLTRLGKRQLVHNIFVHKFLALYTPSPPNQTSDDFPLEIYSRRTSNRIANTQPSPKLRTNPPNIANSQNCEQAGVSDSNNFKHAGVSQNSRPAEVQGDNFLRFSVPKVS